MSEGRRWTFSLQSDLEQLGAKVATLGDVALVMIDPITSYMGRVDADGISERTLRRANKALGVETRKVGFPGGWAWQLPDEGGQQ
jgi:predicted aconitase